MPRTRIAVTAEFPEDMQILLADLYGDFGLDCPDEFEIVRVFVRSTDAQIERRLCRERGPAHARNMPDWGMPPIIIRATSEPNLFTLTDGFHRVWRGLTANLTEYDAIAIEPPRPPEDDDILCLKTR